MPCDVNIYGPFSQTLFMGASISAFSTRIGWNSNESTLDVRVVEDPCSAEKVYYACDTSAQTYTGADAFMPPPLGSPAFFKFGSLEYTGIVRNWKEEKDDAKTYTVSCSGPNVILDAVKLIIGGYTGDVMGVPNIMNVYGFLEQHYGGGCPIDPTLAAILGYSPASGFGGAGKNDAGISWNNIKAAIPLIMASPAPYSGKFGGRPEFKGYSYFIDISALPDTMDDFRFSGDSISLLDLINTVCDYSGLDWRAEILILDNFGTCNTADFNAFIATDADLYIKIRVSDRTVQPTSASSIDGSTADIDTRLNLGTITSFINTINKSNADRGIELRPETTNALVVGDQRQDLWVMNYVSSGTNTYDSNIWPYWGKNPNGYPIISYGSYDKHNFTIDIRDIYEDIVDSVVSGVLGTTYNVEQGELLALLGQGGQSNWEAYIEANKSGLVPYLNLAPDARIYNIVGAKGAAVTIKTDNCKATSRYDAQKAMSISLDENTDFAQRLANKLEGYANEYLGRQFLVAPPVICSAIDGDSPYNIRLNWTESDGAWSDINPFGLPNTPMELFRLQDGRIKCMLKFDNNQSRIDMTSWDSSKYYQWDSGLIYAEATAEEIVFLDPINRLYPRVVVTIDKPITSDKVYLDGLEFTGSTSLFSNLMDLMPNGDAATRQKMRKNVSVSPGADTCAWDRYPMPMIPVAAAVPLKSNILRYGPWYAGTLAEAGPTNFEIMTDLNPWTYGGTTAMGLVGQAIADARVINQQVIELGSITIPGSPAFSIGDSFTGDATSPEITNIDVSFSSDGVRTSYQLRTFTPDYNTFSKTRIDNLRKNAGQIREMQRLNNLARINQVRNPTTTNALGTILNRPDRYRRTSSHAFILSSSFNDYDPLPGLTNAQISGVDQLVKTSRIVNSVVETDLRKCLPELGAGSGALWLTRAGVETAGLFRPFTTLSGSLSLMASFGLESGPSLFFMPSGLEMTGIKSGEAYNEYDVSYNYTHSYRGQAFNEANPPIITSTLNPFLHTSGNINIPSYVALKDATYNYMQIVLGSGHGHDIEYIIRDGVYPIDLSIKYPETNYSQGGWYRGIGLKGPPIIVGWGYDIHGKPVPNYDAGKSPKFADDWLQRPDLWKAGPLDIRWDDSRGVWTSPPDYRIVHIEFMENMAFDAEQEYISAKIISDNWAAYSSSGTVIDDKVIYVDNFMGYPISSGDYGLARFNPDKQGVPNYKKYDLVDTREYTLAIELSGTLSKLTGTSVAAHPRFWNGTGYTTDCTQVLMVADKRNVGYEGIIGAQGAVELRKTSDGSYLGILVDLCCPGDETSDCNSGGSS